MTLGNLTKEFHKLLKNIRTLSDGQAEIVEWDDEDVSNFKVDVKPHDGAYKGGTFRFTVTLGETFPETAPVIRCETHIYHPNIDPTEECDDTNICLNMFNSDEWQEAYGVDGLVQGLLFLFYEPNLEDPLSPYFDSTSEVDFEMNVLASLKGEIVEGVQYIWNFGEKEIVEEKDADQDPSIIKGDNSKSNMVDKAEDIEKGDNSSVDDAVILREKRQSVDLDIIAQRRQGYL
ncbi:NEDD8-conjugating enzyme UBC12-like [Haliotis rubra]|uniref:NEDD8-conjugating enzyme UBC12-like n=1 Tax=Haliotis rubra TaxID=36100 RepID=UPI001EE55F84|nr:NEDD8-conjugating enzyme UBC12-like [Haliotis rubra]